MKLTSRILTIILTAVLAAGIVRYVLPSNQQATVSSETAYDRIMRTNTIRCGYTLYEPFVRKNPNTGEFSGVIVDLMSEIGQLLNFKIEWTEEVGWATAVEGLRTKRYDVMCVGYWRQSLEAKYLFYTVPFQYSKVGVIVRSDDHRFDKNLDTINQPNIRIVSSDGELASAIAKRDYPRAHLQEAPNMTDFTQRLEDIAANKADVTFIDDAITAKYLKSNTYKVRRLDTPPIRIFQNTLAFSQDEKLKSLLDSVVMELIDNGVMDKIIDKYDPDRKMFMRVKRAGQP